MLHNLAEHGLNFASYGAAPTRQLTIQGLYTIIAVQHLLYILSLLYFVRSVSSSFLRQLFALLVIVGVPAFVFYQHGIYSEALTISLLFFQLGATVRIVLRRAPSLADGAVYCTSIYLGGLAREATVFFAVLAPVIFCVLWFWRQRASLGATVIVIVISVLSVAAVKGTTHALALAWDRPTTAFFGRRGIYHMNNAWKSASSEERQTLLAHLRTLSPDPDIQDAFPVALDIKSPWLEAYNKLAEFIQMDPRRQAKWDPDTLLNKLFVLYITHPDRLLLKTVAKTFSEYLENDFSSDIAGILQSTEPGSYDRYLQDDYRKTFQSLSLFSLEERARSRSMRESWLARLWRGIAVVHVTLFIFVLSLICWWRRLLSSPLLVFSLSALFVAWANTAVLAMLTVFLTRYAIESNLLIAAAFATIVGDMNASIGNEE